MFTLTIQEIEKIKFEMEEEGFLTCSDMFMERLKEKENQFLDEHDIYEIKKKELVDEGIKEALNKSEDFVDIPIPSPFRNIPGGYDANGESTAGSFN